MLNAFNRILQEKISKSEWVNITNGNTEEKILKIWKKKRYGCDNPDGDERPDAGRLTMLAWKRKKTNKAATIPRRFRPDVGILIMAAYRGRSCDDSDADKKGDGDFDKHRRKEETRRVFVKLKAPSGTEGR